MDTPAGPLNRCRVSEMFSRPPVPPKLNYAERGRGRVDVGRDAAKNPTNPVDQPPLRVLELRKRDRS